MKTFLKTAATALVLALATATLADASTTLTPRTTTQGAAAKSTVSGTTGRVGVAKTTTVKTANVKAKPRISVAKRHHTHVAHRVLGTKVARTRGFRHMAANHRLSATTTVPWR